MFALLRNISGTEECCLNVPHTRALQYGPLKYSYHSTLPRIAGVYSLKRGRALKALSARRRFTAVRKILLRVTTNARLLSVPRKRSFAKAYRSYQIRRFNLHSNLP